MRSRLAAAGLLAGLIVPFTVAATPGALEAEQAQLPGDDVVVIAVIDSGFNPYHYDWAGAAMPQHLDEDASNDLPLNEAPHTWVTGFDDIDQFSSYNELPLNILSGSRSANQDNPQIKPSNAGDINYHWIPDSKIIGLVDFAGGTAGIGGGTEHGSGTSSVAAGNVYGSCPECLVVMVQYGNDMEGAIEWVESQPWIDVITNSYGASLLLRDRLYSGSDVEAQRLATERGQAIFFSAGNGQGNTFTVANPTLFSSQEGPDWIITVGANHPSSEGSYIGHGRPSDIAAPGGSYPSSYCTASPGCSGDFGGTSNATPVIAGIYAKALHDVRALLNGPSRTQADGVIAVGDPIVCGDERPDCELGDGIVTIDELRNRLFMGARHSEEGYVVHVPASNVGRATPVISNEHEFLAEGHGSYLAKYKGHQNWLDEIARITDPMLGTAAEAERLEGEREWFTVDSYCRQSLWGSWDHGYYVEGETALPGPSPLWPLRSAIEAACPSLFPPF